MSHRSILIRAPICVGGGGGSSVFFLLFPSFQVLLMKPSGAFLGIDTLPATGAKNSGVTGIGVLVR